MALKHGGFKSFMVVKVSLENHYVDAVIPKKKLVKYLEEIFRLPYVVINNSPSNMFRLTRSLST